MIRTVSAARGSLAAVAALVCVSAVEAQAPAAPAASAPVRIDVTIATRGTPVPTLDAKAFTVLVNGAPREVVAAEPAVAAGSGRTFYLAIDETSVFKGAE